MILFIYSYKGITPSTSRRVAGLVSSKRRKNPNPVAQHNNSQGSQQFISYAQIAYTLNWSGVKHWRSSFLFLKFGHKTILYAVSYWTGQTLRGYLYLEHDTERKDSGKDKSDRKTRTDQTGWSSKWENAGNLKAEAQIALRAELVLERLQTCRKTDRQTDRQTFIIYVRFTFQIFIPDLY
jgi:hypothetical protein